jgi:REase_DpnII-MboI
MLEVKKTRKGLEAKEIGEELIIDVARYSNHPDLKTLVCFVYDPEMRIGNPKGLATDLEKRSTDRGKSSEEVICRHATAENHTLTRF